MREDWKAIVGYEGDYEINSEGIIVSIKHNKRKILKTNIGVDGYRRLNLCKAGKTSNHVVHRLVWEAFNGPVPKDKVICHGLNNIRHKVNLEYLSLGTKESNQKDRIRDNTYGMKLKEAQAKSIKSMLREGLSQAKIAELFCVCQKTISKIKCGVSWAHIS